MINSERLLQTFLDIVQIDSPSGHEHEISAHLHARLQDLGMQTLVDEASSVLGRCDGQGEPLLLSAHMDTVSPGRGVQPVVHDGVVCTDGTTILGGDDKSGVAVILEVLTCLQEQGQQPAVEVVFSTGEEIGLLGAKALDVTWFRACQALVLDSGGPINVLVHGAPSSDKFDATVYGQAAHAGSNPEDGINAIQVASQAIAGMPLGRIDVETTANIGLIQGGQAVNVVPDRVEIHGEARSHTTTKLDAQIAAMRQALEKAVSECPGARLEIEIRRAYESYRLSEQDPLLQRICQALRDLGHAPPAFKLSGGGSDANIFNARGIRAIPISTGMQSVHTTQECIALDDMVTCARLVLHMLAG